MKWKLPPRIKVLEALGSVADKRMTVRHNLAKVSSSTGEREYTVVYDPERKEIDSDDNGSVYKGYLGYPSIAMLMVKGKLSFDKEIANALRKIPWKRLNERYKSYERVEQIVKNIVTRSGVKRKRIDRLINQVLREITQLSPKRLEREKKLENFIP